ncbi:MAG: hypothetical protein ACM3SW_06965, partial [Actinomycetota bacterium]
MTTHAMNHQQALDEHATERYLLREMTAEERRAFEEHYLDCAECLEAVTFGTEFMDAGHEVALEQKHELAAQPVPSWRERLLPAVSGWLRPVPALAFALLLCFGGIAYQATTIHRQQEKIASLQGLRPEYRFVLTGIAHGAGESNLVQVPQGAVITLGVEYNRSGEYVSYVARVISETGTVKQRIALPNVPGDMANIAVPPNSLQPGRYEL